MADDTLKNDPIIIKPANTEPVNAFGKPIFCSLCHEKSETRS